MNKYLPNWILKLLGHCPKHGWFKYPRKFRNLANYEDDSANYEYGCKICQEKSNAYWEDMWKNLYGIGYSRSDVLKQFSVFGHTNKGKSIIIDVQAFHSSDALKRAKEYYPDCKFNHANLKVT